MTTKYVCLCNNCYNLFYDTNPQVRAKQFVIDGLSELTNNCCPICETDDYLTDDISHKLWEMLGDIPVNDNDEIDAQFLHFPIGTDRFEIWHWFEDTFDLSVYNDLMFTNYKDEKFI